jgi:putative nucleotidyltransferase with HDIG domain
MHNKISDIAELSSMVVLYVEDDPDISEVFERHLNRLVGEVYLAQNGQEALEIYKRYPIDIILTDIKMPVMNGLELAQAVREDNIEIPIVIISAYSEVEYLRQAFEVGISHYMNKPVDSFNLQRVLNECAKSVMYQRRQMQMKQNFDETIHAFLELIEKRDRYTAGHTNRVALYCGLIAERMGYSEEDISYLKHAALLHDIGKIEIPDSILLKPHRLNNLEYEIIKEHLMSGYTILSKIKEYHRLAEIVLYHHERYDGNGYPNGLKGEEIPPIARIMIVADAFDAMTTDRIYKPRKSVNEALEELRIFSKIQFHPEVVEAACEALKEVVIDEGSGQFPEGNLESKKFDYFFSDKITDLGNEDYFAMLLNQQRIKEYRFVTLIDIGRMSSYNVMYGWKQGNALLQEIAAVLKETFADTKMFRMNGDHFVILSTEELAYDEHLLDNVAKESKIFFRFYRYEIEEYLKVFNIYKND